MRDHMVANLRYLSQMAPQLAAFFAGTTRDAQSYRLGLSKTKAATLSCHAPDNGREAFFHSRYNPVHEARVWAEQQAGEIGEKKHLLVYGVGLGYQVEQLSSLYPNKKMYLFEPDPEVWMALMQARNMAQILSQPGIAAYGVGADPDMQRQFIVNMIHNITGDFHLIVLPFYKQHYAQQLMTFTREVDKYLLEYRSSYVTTRFYQKQWTANILQNLNAVLESRSIKGLQHAFRQVPAVIIGSGPSLMDDLHLLSQVKNHALLISAGTSIQALLHHGIKPHIVVSVDGGEPNYRAFSDLALHNVSLFYTSFIHHGIIKETSADKYYFFSKPDRITKHVLDARDEPDFETAFSVTGVAIQLAAFLGCPKIVLTGQDLSYPDQLHYSHGVDHIDDGNLAYTISMADEQIMNVQGGYNPTSPKMLATLRNIERIIAQYKSVAFANSSKRGARIAGTEFKPMETVLREIEHHSVHEDWVKQQLNALSEPFSTVQRRHAYDKLMSMHLSLDALSRKLVDLSSRIESLRSETAASNNEFAKIDQIWVDILNRSHLREVLKFLFQIQLSDLRRYSSEIRNEQDPHLKTSLVQQHLGSVVREMIQEMPFLRETLEQLLPLFADEEQKSDVIQKGAE